MEHWHTTSTAPYQSEGHRLAQSSRILANSSGNVQTYALDSKEGIENQNPFPGGRYPTKQELKPELHFPIPKVKLPSNDHYAGNYHRLQARRQHHHREKIFRPRRSNADRPYLQHPKYLQYRARQRCDTGPDGKPVWDDRIEDAFQNALVNIEPMGRRKKSQKGKPYGRNELISEWIVQETGEYRTRKQVSSHIQVLNTLLKGITGCEHRILAGVIADVSGDALITAIDDHRPERPGHEYYSDSIEKMVRGQKMGGSTHYHSGGTSSSTQSHLPGGFVDKHSLTRLSFEMWVSLPNHMEQALHIYSRLQSSNATSIPMPLEDVKNWRVTFPSLRPIVDSWQIDDSCDIILLEASFRLMSDFPPKFSKLGISLELDFLHPSNNNGGSLAAMKGWSCKTHMYQHGRLVKEVAHNECHVAGLGKVKPFFESKWWASTFTQLTERRKMAEDSKKDGAIELANEYSGNFLRGLTVMQEISAGLVKNENVNESWPDQHLRGKRMAILLWKFSQAPSGFVGTTTWHKVIPPSEHMPRNNSLASDMSLPTLTMDTILNNPHNDNLFDPNNTFMSNTDQQYNIFADTQDSNLYHDFPMSGFEDSTFELDPSQLSLDHDMNMAFDVPSHDMAQLSAPSAHPTTNFFEIPQLSRRPSEHHESIHTMSQHGSFDDHDTQSIHQPLAKFDMSTHKILQAQLGADDDPFYAQTQQQDSQTMRQILDPQPASTPQHFSVPSTDEDDEALRAALLAASAMSDLGNQQHSFTQPAKSMLQPDPLYIPNSHPFTSPSTLAVTRPPLQTHHSFAGIGTSDHHDLHNLDPAREYNHRLNGHNHSNSISHSRNSSKNDFAAVLANLQAYNANQDLNFSLDFNVDAGNEDLSLGIGMVTDRPHSQPVLNTNSSDALYEEVIGHIPHTAAGETHSEPGDTVLVDRIHSHADVGEQTQELVEEDGYIVLKTEDFDQNIGVGEIPAAS